ESETEGSALRRRRTTRRRCLRCGQSGFRRRGLGLCAPRRVTTACGGRSLRNAAAGGAVRDGTLREHVGASVREAEVICSEDVATCMVNERVFRKFMLNPYYVYALKDPRTSPARPFYIGKGTGNRAWEHTLRVDQTRKGKRIAEI